MMTPRVKLVFGSYVTFPDLHTIISTEELKNISETIGQNRFLKSNEKLLGMKWVF